MQFFSVYFGLTVANFIFLGSKTIVDGDCSHEMKRCLLLGRKAMTKLDSILKSRSITLPTKVHLVKAMVFPIVVYRCESWTIKKSVGWRIDAFKLWYWWRLLRIPRRARRSNQVINPEYSLAGLTLKPKFPTRRPPKDLGAGKDWRQEEKGVTEDKMDI